MKELSASRHVEPKLHQVPHSQNWCRLLQVPHGYAGLFYMMYMANHMNTGTRMTPLNEWPSEHEMEGDENKNPPRLTDSESEYEGTTMNLKENVQNMKNQANVDMRPCQHNAAWAKDQRNLVWQAQ